MTNELMDFAPSPTRHCGEQRDAAIQISEDTATSKAALPRSARNDNKNGWTEERRAKMRARIHEWQPWKNSTGPRTKRGKKKSAGNATKHGHRGLA